MPSSIRLPLSAAACCAALPLGLAGCDADESRPATQAQPESTTVTSASPSEKEAEATKEEGASESSATPTQTSSEEPPVPENVVLDPAQDPDAMAAPSGSRGDAEKGSQGRGGSGGCGSSDARTAFQTGAATLEPWGGSGWIKVDDKGFDPCASLSWQTAMIEHGSASSPFHILLFHYGEYLGTATAKPFGFMPTVTQASDTKLDVVYHYQRPGDSVANRSGTTEASFTWDEGRNMVVMAGSTPPSGGS